MRRQTRSQKRRGKSPIEVDEKNEYEANNAALRGRKNVKIEVDFEEEEEEKEQSRNSPVWEYDQEDTTSEMNTSLPLREDSNIRTPLRPKINNAPVSINHIQEQQKQMYANIGNMIFEPEIDYGSGGEHFSTRNYTHIEKRYYDDSATNTSNNNSSKLYIPQHSKQFRSKPSIMISSAEETNKKGSSNKVTEGKATPVLKGAEVTKKGMWNPISFSEKYFYGSKNGVPLSRTECEEAMSKLAKNDYQTDYYPYLELAQKFHSKDKDMEQMCLGLAFSTAMQNRLALKLRKSSQSTNCELAIVAGNGFSLDEAMRDEEWISLPSLKKFKMSQLLTSHQASKWTSFDENSTTLLRTAFKKLAAFDQYFPVYSPTDYSTSNYFPLGTQFYRDVSKFLYQGFKLEFSLELQAKCHGMAREVLTYLQDRFRKEYNDNSSSTVAELSRVFMEKLENNELEEEEIDFASTPVFQNFRSLQII